MKFPPFLHSHLRLTLLGTPPWQGFSFENVKKWHIFGDPCQGDGAKFEPTMVGLPE
jgi:hypothetical protein